MSSAAPEKEVPQHAPGQELRVAREAAGISLTDLADRTLISPYRLEALERDDYDAVGGAAYVKGYARACARQLQLNPNHVVQGFEEKLASSRPLHSDPNAAGQRRQAAPVEFGDESGSSPLRTLISGVLALIVLGLFLAVLFGDSGRHDAEIEQNNLEAVMPEAAHDGQSFTTSVADLELPQLDRLQNEEALQDEEGQPGESAPDVPHYDPQSESAGHLETEAPASAVKPSAQATDSHVAPSTATVLSQVPIRLLEMSFTEACWVEVTDANGERIIAREAQSGDNLRLSGLAPLVVVLGNAPAASVSLDGEPVPIRLRAGTNVVRLNLGAP